MHDIAGYDLVVCSDYLTDVSIAKGLYVKSKSDQNKQNSRDLVASYNNRKVKWEGYSLYEYYYKVFSKKEFYTDSTTSREKNRILIPKGMNCKARYPVDYDYARGMLVMHKPWSKRNPLKPILEDHELTISTFRRMLDKQKLPYVVRAEYHRAVKNVQQWRYECVTRKATVVEEVNVSNGIDNEELHNHDYWEHSNHLSAQNTRHLNDHAGERRVNLGIDHDWSQQCFSGTRAADRMTPEEYTRYLRDHFYNNTASDENKEPLHIPKKANGTDYDIEDLNEEQKIIVICALEAVVKFLTNDPTYKPLRATVVGCGGTGKSFIINTLISIMRNYTGFNDTVKVAAPSGGAAYNIGGCTLHRCLNLAVDPDKLAKDLNPDQQKDLSHKLRNLLALIVDERSMISSALLAGAERNIRHCAFGQQNTDELWGGIPVVLIFGDDYQLMPVKAEGAISGYSKLSNIWEENETRKAPSQQLQINAGNALFIENLTQDVFHLTKNYRSRNDPEYAKILKSLRVGKTSREDAARLMKLFWSSQTDTEWKREIEDDPKTINLFAHNHEKNLKNRDKLVDMSNSTECPVARLQCQWQSNNQGTDRVYKTHFSKSKIVLETDLCVGATVALSDNIVPEAGLYNGARGTVVDFIYRTVAGPNDKHGEPLPLCIICDYPGLRLNGAKPWDERNPTVSVNSTNQLGQSLQFPYSVLTRTICSFSLFCPKNCDNPACTHTHGAVRLSKEMLQRQVLPVSACMGNNNS